MARCDDALCTEVEVAVAMVVARVAEEDAGHGARAELVQSCGDGVGEAKAPEDAPVVYLGGRPRRSWYGVMEPEARHGRLLIK